MRRFLRMIERRLAISHPSTLLNRLRMYNLPLIELILLSTMGIVLMIPSNVTPTTPWTQLSPPSLFRGVVWLLGLLILPSLYLIKSFKPDSVQSRLTILAVGVNLSLALVGLVVLILYYAQLSLFLTPWIFLALLVFAGLYIWFSSTKKDSFKLKFSRLDIVLVIAFGTTIIIAALIQFGQRYLISGDNWVILKASMDMLSTSDLYQVWNQNYPLFFGFIMTGLSVSAGLPVVNTYVLLFPLTALNSLCFYVLVREVFPIEKKIAVIAVIIYSFTGGLGYLVQAIVYKGSMSFWVLSNMTQDMYFNEFFWYNIQFSYKSLAITMAFASIALCALSIKQKTLGKFRMLTLASILMAFSFSIHMIEILIFMPVILILIYLYSTSRSRYINLGFFAIVTFLFVFLVDILTQHYYSWLIWNKITNTFIVQANFTEVYIIPSIVVVSIMLLSMHYIGKDLNKFSNLFNIGKSAFVAGLIVVYLYGLYLWAIISPPTVPVYTLTPLPWYYQTTRFGIVGLIAILGLTSTKWTERWFWVSSFWCLLSLSVGTIWWGSRITSYIYPIIALLAALGLNKLMGLTNSIMNISLTNIVSDSVRKFTVRLKLIAIISYVTILLLASSSLIYGVSYYSFSPPSMTDDEADAFSWMYQNTPRNATILVPDVYSIKLGVITLASRNIIKYTEVPSFSSSDSLVSLFGSIKARNVRYLLVSTEYDYKSTQIVDYLIRFSYVVYRSNSVRIYKLPLFSPPSMSEYSVEVINREPIGFLTDESTVGWLDDTFIDGWSNQNSNVTSDGDIMIFEGSFDGEEVPVPSTTRDIPLIDTNSFRYIVIRYRNNPKTTIEVSQVVTLRNESGWYGTIGNVYLPHTNGTFSTIVEKLPPNQEVANINIWLRNYKRLNGSVGLEFDYIAFSSIEIDRQDLAKELCLLSLSVPATWSMKYYISTEFNISSKASIIVSAYDKSAINFVKLYPESTKFIFFNASAVIPSWGIGWTHYVDEIVTGFVDGRQVFVAKIQDDLLTLSERLYQLLS